MLIGGYGAPPPPRNVTAFAPFLLLSLPGTFGANGPLLCLPPRLMEDILGDLLRYRRHCHGAPEAGSQGKKDRWHLPGVRSEQRVPVETGNLSLSGIEKALP